MRGGVLSPRTLGAPFLQCQANRRMKARSWRYRCDEVGAGEGVAADFEGPGEETGADAEGTGLAVYLALASSIFEASPWFCGSSFKAFCQ